MSAVASFTPAHRGGSGPPLVCLHGFTDTWRTWELALPALERRHDVLAMTLPGHAGGTALGADASDDRLLDDIERRMDDAGFATAHVAGNSLGGYLALKLAARGRARSVVALAPGGGWAAGDDSYLEMLDGFTRTYELVRAAAPHADALLASPEGRRQATQYTVVNYEHIPTELLAHQLCGAAACAGTMALVEHARREGWTLEHERVSCPVRVVWGTQDRILEWPRAAARYREQWLPGADWVVLDDVGHLLQLDVPLETTELILGFTGAGPS